MKIICRDFGVKISMKENHPRNIVKQNGVDKILYSQKSASLHRKKKLKLANSGSV